MSLFLAICQGVGLSIAVGTFAGASGRRDAIGVALAIAAAIAGAVLFAISMSNRDHPAIVGVPLGAILAVVSYGVVSAVVAGAQARVKGASSIGLIVAGDGARAGGDHGVRLGAVRAATPGAPALARFGPPAPRPAQVRGAALASVSPPSSAVTLQPCPRRESSA